MASRHICPKCGGKTFDTTVHVMQSWKVDENGEFIEVLDDCLEVTHEADDGNTWTCTNCGAEAVIMEE